MTDDTDIASAIEGDGETVIGDIASIQAKIGKNLPFLTIIYPQNKKALFEVTTEKQIIGRGTRIDDRYNKLWFTILDFKKATELFADEDFDGPPVQVMDTRSCEIIDIENTDFDIELDNVNNEDAENDSGQANERDDLEANDTGLDGTWDDANESDYVKYRVSGVTVRKVAERVQYYGSDGKLVTESFKDYTRNTVKKCFTSLDDFTRKWQDSERKQIIIDELASEGVIWQALEDEVSKDMDPFDLICHVVFDQPALSRKERAHNVKTLK